jgi:hypothetical protein
MLQVADQEGAARWRKVRIKTTPHVSRELHKVFLSLHRALCMRNKGGTYFAEYQRKVNSLSSRDDVRHHYPHGCPQRRIVMGNLTKNLSRGLNSCFNGKHMITGQAAAAEAPRVLALCFRHALVPLGAASSPLRALHEGKMQTFEGISSPPLTDRSRLQMVLHRSVAAAEWQHGGKPPSIQVNTRQCRSLSSILSSLNYSCSM